MNKKLLKYYNKLEYCPICKKMPLIENDDGICDIVSQCIHLDNVHTSGKFNMTLLEGIGYWNAKVDIIREVKIIFGGINNNGTHKQERITKE